MPDGSACSITGKGIPVKFPAVRTSICRLKRDKCVQWLDESEKAVILGLSADVKRLERWALVASRLPHSATAAVSALPEEPRLIRLRILSTGSADGRESRASPGLTGIAP